MLHDARRRKNIQIGLAGLAFTLIFALAHAVGAWHAMPLRQEAETTDFPDPCGLVSVECPGE